jgi:hypothetical protein
MYHDMMTFVFNVVFLVMGDVEMLIVHASWTEHGIHMLFTLGIFGIRIISSSFELDNISWL